MIDLKERLLSHIKINPETQHEAAHEFFKDTPPEVLLNIGRTMDL